MSREHVCYVKDEVLNELESLIKSYESSLGIYYNEVNNLDLTDAFNIFNSDMELDIILDLSRTFDVVVEFIRSNEDEVVNLLDEDLLDSKYSYFVEAVLTEFVQRDVWLSLVFVVYFKKVLYMDKRG